MIIQTFSDNCYSLKLSQRVGCHGYDGHAHHEESANDRNQHQHGGCRTGENRVQPGFFMPAPPPQCRYGENAQKYSQSGSDQQCSDDDGTHYDRDRKIRLPNHSLCFPMGRYRSSPRDRRILIDSLAAQPAAGDVGIGQCLAMRAVDELERWLGHHDPVSLGPDSRAA